MSKSVAVKESGFLTTEAPSGIDPAMSGLGTSSDRADLLVPFLGVLQDNSPQVKRREDKYIEGSEAGMIIRTDINRVYSGETGVPFVPCVFQKRWVEWVPRMDGGGGGKGFVASHYVRPEAAQNKIEDGKLNPNRWFLPGNGHDLVETRYHYGLLLDPSGSADAVVIGMSGTSHTVSRQWMSKQRSFVVDGITAPAFFRAYNLKTSFVKRGDQSWYVFKPEDMGWINKLLREQGYDLYQSITSGEREAAQPAPPTDEPIPF